ALAQAVASAARPNRADRQALNGARRMPSGRFLIAAGLSGNRTYPVDASATPNRTHQEEDGGNHRRPTTFVPFKKRTEAIIRDQLPSSLLIAFAEDSVALARHPGERRDPAPSPRLVTPAQAVIQRWLFPPGTDAVHCICGSLVARSSRGGRSAWEAYRRARLILRGAGFAGLPWVPFAAVLLAPFHSERRWRLLPCKILPPF